MTIKKPMKAPTAEPVAAAPAGAAIADRLRLDVPDPNAKKAGGAGTVVTLIAGLIALGVAGFLTFLMYQHWEFLQGA